MNQVNEYEKYALVENQSPMTIKSYKSYISEFTIYILGNYSDQRRIVDYLAYLRAVKHYKPSTINVARSAIIYLYENVLNRPIMVKIPKVKRPKSKPNPLDRQTIYKMLETETVPYKLAIIEMAYGSGMRREEIAKAKWENVLWNVNKIKVEEGKGGKDRITVMSRRLKEVLLGLFHTRRMGNDYIFSSFTHPDRNWHISKKGVYKAVKDAMLRVNPTLKGGTHRLRHSFGTHCIENRVPPKYVQAMMGHQSGQTTEGYQEVAEARLFAVRSPLDEIEQGIAEDRRVAEEAMLNATDSTKH